MGRKIGRANWKLRYANGIRQITYSSGRCRAAFTISGPVLRTSGHQLAMPSDRALMRWFSSVVSVTRIAAAASRA